MATIDSLANETLLQIMEELKLPRVASDRGVLQPGRYDALRAAALVCRRWRDPAQQALYDEVELFKEFPLRPGQFLVAPARLRHHTRSLFVSDADRDNGWTEALTVATKCDGLQNLHFRGLWIRWTDLSRPCFAGLKTIHLSAMMCIAEPRHLGDSLPAGVSSFALWANFEEYTTEFLAALSSASKDSLKTLHLHLFPNVEEVKLCPALTDIGPHLPALVLDTDPWEILENSLDIFPIFKSLRSFSWNGLGRFDPLTADHTGNLGTILDAFPSPATLTHLSVGTEDFFSLAHITPLLSHPTLALLTKLDLPSLPSSTPAEQASDVAAMAKACEERGIQWTVGGVAQ